MHPGGSQRSEPGRCGLVWPMRKLLFCLLVLPAAVAMAAEPAVTFDIQPRVVRLGESATASLTFRGLDNPVNPGFPEINGFQVQPAGTETSLSLRGDAQETTTTIKYTLVPVRSGKTTIGPFTYDDGKGHKFELPGVTLEVLDPSGAAAGGSAQPLFARMEPSTTNLYVQQVFDLVLKIYVSTRLNLHNPGSLQNMPAQGLVTRDWRRLDMTREAVDGEIYNVFRFSTKAQALTAARYDLAPVQRVELAGQKQRRRGPFGDDFFDSFFGVVPTESREIAIAPFTLDIRPLPAEGRPAAFSGAVGHYDFDMTAKPLELSAGDPVTLNFKIAGAGNIDGVQMPAFQPGDHFKAYDPKLTSQNINPNSATGEKTFEQVIIPKSEDARLIPEVTFAYFDPDRQSYQTIKRGPFPLAVRPKSRDQASLIVEQQGASPEASQKAATLGADIVYLKPAPRAWRTLGAAVWYAHPAALAAQALPALAVAAVFLLVRRRDHLAGDIAKSRRMQAPRTARAGIARARAAIAANDAKQFYEALWVAMSSYFGNRLNLAPGEVSSDRIDAAFAAAAFQGPQRQLVKDLFASCEQARFAGTPPFDAAASEKLIAELEDALRACERIAL